VIQTLEIDVSRLRGFTLVELLVVIAILIALLLPTCHRGLHGGKHKWMENGISIAGVSERDIDLLLLEEFLSSPDFSDWFVMKALGDSVNLGRCMEARRSVSDGSGESDLEISFVQEDGVRTRLLIENKVNAGYPAAFSRSASAI